MNPAQGPPVATYQTRVSGYVGLDREAGDAALATYAELYGQVERKLFAEVAAGRSAAPLKSDYIRERGIPARLFNAVRITLDGKVKAYFISRGYRQGVEVHQVNPAFSSVVGRVKFMERYGLTVHQAAALVLARRLLGCSERIPRRWVCPVGNGVQVAFTIPERKRVKHVWTYRGAIAGQLRPALAAQHRLGRPNPVRAVVRAEARGVA